MVSMIADIVGALFLNLADLLHSVSHRSIFFCLVNLSLNYNHCVRKSFARQLSPKSRSLERLSITLEEITFDSWNHR